MQTSELTAERAEAASWLSSHRIEGVHFRVPTIDGRLIGKFVHAREFVHVATTGIRLHPAAVAEARTDLSGGLLASAEDEPELRALPALDTLCRLPWEPRMAQVLCDLYDHSTGAPAGECVRGTLARAHDELVAEMGLGLEVGIEPEVIWVRRAADGSVQPVAHTLSFYDASAMLDFEPVLLDLVRTCEALGIAVTEASSEGLSQLEVNHAPRSALAAADAVMLFRLACGAIARRHGLIASFMPKPWADAAGSGHHHNLSLVDARSGEPRGIGKLKGRCCLSECGVHFLGGLLRHVDALTALGAPTVNSYKRLADRGQWASTSKSFGFDDRSCVFRIPAPGRIEVRYVDAAANPYLTLTGMLAAGVDGLRRSLDPGAPSDESGKGVPERIPASLEAALAAFEGDLVVRNALPQQVSDAFLALRRDELERYASQVSAWELDFYLERWP